MSDKLPRDPSPEVQEDLQEAAFAEMRRALTEAKVALVLGQTGNSDRGIDNLMADAIWLINAILEGDAGRMFLAHLQRLEAENAVLRQDVLRYLAENARIRGLLAHFEHCPHGCQDAGFCPHYKRVRELGLLESSAKP